MSHHSSRRILIYQNIFVADDRKNILEEKREYSQMHGYSFIITWDKTFGTVIDLSKMPTKWMWKHIKDITAVSIYTYNDTAKDNVTKA